MQKRRLTVHACHGAVSSRFHLEKVAHQRHAESQPIFPLRPTMSVVMEHTRQRHRSKNLQMLMNRHGQGAFQRIKTRLERAISEDKHEIFGKSVANILTELRTLRVNVVPAFLQHWLFIFCLFDIKMITWVYSSSTFYPLPTLDLHFILKFYVDLGVNLSTRNN